MEYPKFKLKIEKKDEKSEILNPEDELEQITIDQRIGMEFMRHVENIFPVLSRIYNLHFVGKNVSEETKKDIASKIEIISKVSNLKTKEDFETPYEVLVYMLMTFIEERIGKQLDPTIFKLGIYKKILTDEKLIKRLDKYDEESWKIIANKFVHLFQFVLDEHVESVIQIVKNYVKLSDNSEFGVEIMDIVLHYKQYVNMETEKALNSSCDGYDQFVDTVTDSDSEDILKVINYLNKRFGTITMSPDVYNKVIQECENYCIMNNLSNILKKYLVIIIWSIIHKDFNVEKFKNVINKRLYNLEWDNYETARKYLLSNLKLDSLYDGKKRKINELIYVIRESDKKNKQEIEEEVGHLNNIYKERLTI